MLILCINKRFSLCPNELLGQNCWSYS